MREILAHCEWYHCWAGDYAKKQGCIRKQAEEAIQSKPVCSTSPQSLFLASRFLLFLNSHPSFHQCWAIIITCKINKLFPPQVVVVMVFITAVKSN